MYIVKESVSEMFKKRWTEEDYMERSYGSKCEGSDGVDFAVAFLARMLYLSISSLI
jgi:hypothetical protein